MSLESYESSFSEQSFWEKIARVPSRAGCSVLRSALTLIVLLKSDLPLWAKASIVGALGYFICPLDALPDFLPGGFVDDLAAMTLVLGQLYAFVDKDIRERVQELLPEHCRGVPVMETTEGT